MVMERERETDRDRDRERDTETQRDTERERQRDTEREPITIGVKSSVSKRVVGRIERLGNVSDTATKPD